MVREADQYFGSSLEYLVEAVLVTPPLKRRSQEMNDAAWEKMRTELTLWESLIKGDYLTGGLSVVDFSLFPEVALAQRIAERNPGLVKQELLGLRLGSWAARMKALAVVRKTWHRIGSPRDARRDALGPGWHGLQGGPTFLEPRSWPTQVQILVETTAPV